MEVVENKRAAEAVAHCGKIPHGIHREDGPAAADSREFREGNEPAGNQHVSRSGLGGARCPLILYDRAIGMIAVQSLQERVFDEQHVELLRVLSSESAVAIDNARLFSQEQKKSRQLTLINNVSSHAISTMNPEEMLAKIVQEIEIALQYDHIGIATIDYSAKELVVQAEAGTRREAMGRRILIGEGLVGQVARSGQLLLLKEISAASLKPVLASSMCAIALPVMYADQLLGVLYIESA